MIRLFTIIYHVDLDKLPSASKLFHSVTKQFCIQKAICPMCKEGKNLEWHDTYKRNLVSYEDKQICEETVMIKRTICPSCKHTHALIPDVLIPFKTYGILFILSVLKAYFFRRQSKQNVIQICDHFGIAHATLYAWKRRYLKHKKIFLGAVEKYISKRDPHLNNPPDKPFFDYLHLFFSQFGCSFLQYMKATESGSG